MASEPASSASDVFGTNAGQMPRTRSVLMRALLGLVLLFIIAAGGAWLMHAGIQAEAEPAPEEAAVSVQSAPVAPSR